MLKKLLFTTALSGLMLSSALAQSSSEPSASSGSTPSSSASTITAPGPDQMLVSSLRGVDVMGNNDEKIGDISDILVSKDGKVEAYVVGIGGFLGVGAKDIALPPSSIQLTQDNNNNWKAKVNASKDQLAQAPTFERSKDRATTTGAGSSGGMQRSTTSPPPATSTPPARQ
jgi:sporulation protein YlmC with PRC-barrel domain